jgi:diaminopimelate epimerase
MINFEKWHGNGNDFVIINSIEQSIKLKKSFIKKISDRNKGIGFDQLIVIGLPTKYDHDFFVRFYNSDSSEASMCLNGIRCASSYIWKNSLAPKKRYFLKPSMSISNAFLKIISMFL